MTEGRQEIMPYWKTELALSNTSLTSLICSFFPDLSIVSNSLKWRAGSHRLEYWKTYLERKITNYIFFFSSIIPSQACFIVTKRSIITIYFSKEIKQIITEEQAKPRTQMCRLIIFSLWEEIIFFNSRYQKTT